MEQQNVLILILCLVSRLYIINPFLLYFVHILFTIYKLFIKIKSVVELSIRPYYNVKLS